MQIHVLQFSHCIYAIHTKVHYGIYQAKGEACLFIKWHFDVNLLQWLWSVSIFEYIYPMLEYKWFTSMKEYWDEIKLVNTYFLQF